VYWRSANCWFHPRQNRRVIYLLTQPLLCGLPRIAALARAAPQGAAYRIIGCETYKAIQFGLRASRACACAQEHQHRLPATRSSLLRRLRPSAHRQACPRAVTATIPLSESELYQGPPERGRAHRPFAGGKRIREIATFACSFAGTDRSSQKNAMARPKRFELLTPRFVVWCSIQLSYGR
jgi:hypothetical protein